MRRRRCAALALPLAVACDHDASSAQEQMVFAATKAAPSLTKFDPEAPPSIVAIVDRALAFDQANRWPTARSMREAIVEAYAALFGDPPSTTLLAELAAAGESTSSAYAPSDPLAPTLAAPVGVSTRPRRRPSQPIERPAETSLAGTSAQPQTAAAGRARIAVRVGIVAAPGRVAIGGSWR